MGDHVNLILKDELYLKDTDKQLFIEDSFRTISYTKFINFFLYKTLYLNIINIINNNNNDAEKAKNIINYITNTSIYDLNNLTEPKMKEQLVVINKTERNIKVLINKAITDIITGIENIEDIYSKITEELSALGIKLDDIKKKLELQPNIELITNGKKTDSLKYINYLEIILESLNNKLKKDLMIGYINLKEVDPMLKPIPIGVIDNIRMLDTNYVRKIPNKYTKKKTMDLGNKLNIKDHNIPIPIQKSPDIDSNTPTDIFTNNSENRKNITKNKRTYTYGQKKYIYINKNIIKNLQHLNTYRSTGVKKYTQEKIINRILMLFSYEKNFDIENIVENPISNSNSETKKKSKFSKELYSILNNMFNYLYKNYYGNNMNDSVDEKIQNIKMQMKYDLEIPTIELRP